MPGSLPRRPSRCERRFGTSPSPAVLASVAPAGRRAPRGCVSSSRIRRSAGRRWRSTPRLSSAAMIRSAVAATSVRRPLPRCSRWSQQAGTCSGSSPHRRRPRRPRAGEPVSSARPRACRAPPGSLTVWSSAARRLRAVVGGGARGGVLDAHRGGGDFLHAAARKWHDSALRSSSNRPYDHVRGEAL